MTAQRHERVSEIFLALIDKPEDQQIALLSTLCGPDLALRRDVESLLRHDRAAAWVDRAPVFPSVGQTSGPAAFGDAAPPQQIGAYQILGLLGHGGMGAVYRARQLNPPREVALKIIPTTFATPDLLRRFEFEAAILGRLSHPGIAKVFEAGVSLESGRRTPFFAMELVNGQPAPLAAARMRWSIRQRAELLVEICEALQHAHQRGVIHRDLKPGNILVDDGGRPRILDFGVARVIDEDVGATLHTAAGQIIGTPAYMSPEQISGDPREIDTRTDIYSLGVVAYELLSGQLPLDLSGASLARALEIVRDTTPARLGAVAPECRGDLETIVGKAMAKDKEQRYPSAAAMGADLQRFLRDEPILAVPPSTSYRVYKFARRHRALVAGASVALLSVLGGAAAATFGLWRATQERDEAIEARGLMDLARLKSAREADRAVAVNAFLNRMFESANPFEAGARDVTVGEWLDREAARIHDAFPGQPEIEANVRATIGVAYRSLGRLPEAEAHLRAAIDRQRLARGEETADFARMQRELASVLLARGDVAAAKPLFREALATSERVLGRQSRSWLIALGRLGMALIEAGELEEAERSLREATAGLAALPTPGDEDLAIMRNNLGRVLRASGKLEQAEEFYRAAYADFLRIHGESNPQTGIALNNVARALGDRGKLDEAEQAYREALRILTASLGPQHPSVADVLNNLSNIHFDLKDFDESLTTIEQAIGIYRATRGEAHPDFVAALNNRGFTLIELKRAADALDDFDRVRAAHVARYGAEHLRVTLSDVARGDCLVELQRYQEAEQVLLPALERIRAERGLEHQQTRNVLRRIVILYERWGKPAERERFATLQASPPPPSP